ncbi:hypothetical protein ACFOPN_10030 [Xanthomonas hyacinthi]|uniref:hypothetical protein n=1 Tax=Xanthomonas hyacinthi TaxID=56455 RepID=UPI0036182FF3
MSSIPWQIAPRLRVHAARKRENVERMPTRWRRRSAGGAQVRPCGLGPSGRQPAPRGVIRPPVRRCATPQRLAT